MADLPIEVITDIVSYIDHPKDLLPLALANRSFYALIVPDHLEYRQIVIPPHFPVFWKYLSKNPKLACNIRELRITCNPAWAETIIPKRFKNILNPRVLYCWPEVWEAFAEFKNLRIFSCFFILSDKAFIGLDRALVLSNCRLEEFNVSISSSFRFPFPKASLSSLTKFTLEARVYDGADAAALLHLFLRVPNLTHFKFQLISRYLLLWDILDSEEIHWPNLSALTVSYFGPGPVTPHSGPSLIGMPHLYGTILPKFLVRHHTIEYFAFDVSLRVSNPSPSAVDNLLPKLKSLRVDMPCMLAYLLFPLSFKTMTHATLCHRDLHICVSAPFLETVVLTSQKGYLSLPSLVFAAPNITKLYMAPSRSFDHAMETVSTLKSLTKLAHLLGLFRQLDFEDHQGKSNLKDLYRTQSLTYIDMRERYEHFCVRLLRDGERETVDLQLVSKSVEDPDQYLLWGGFFGSADMD